MIRLNEEDSDSSIAIRRMNTIRAALERDVAQEVVERGGLEAYREHALQHLRLKTVVRESHTQPVTQLSFCAQPGAGNLVATVGSNQATVYDDVHMGDHVALVVRYTNARPQADGPTGAPGAPPPAAGGGKAPAPPPESVLTSLAWVSCAGLLAYPSGDAWLAVGGRDGSIQVLSVAEARVVRLLLGHAGEVQQLSGASRAPGLLLSLAAGGDVRLWDVAAGACVMALRVHDACAAELHPDASYFLTGHPKGHVQLWHLAPHLARLLDQPLPPPTSTSRHDVAAALAAEGGAPVGGAGAVPVVDLTGGVPPPPPLQQQQQQQQGAQEGGEEEGLREGEHYMGLQPVLAVPQPAVSKDQAPIECIRCLPDDQVAVRTWGGHVGVWSLRALCAHLQSHQQQQQGAAMETDGPSVVAPPGEPVWSRRLPGCASAGAQGTAPAARCLMDAGQDGAYLCCGNGSGSVYVLDGRSGRQVCVAAADRVEAPVRACGLSHDARHLWAVLGNGFIFRFEYVRPAPALLPAAAAAAEDDLLPEAAAGGVAGLAERRRGTRGKRASGLGGDGTEEEEADDAVGVADQGQDATA